MRRLAVLLMTLVAVLAAAAPAQADTCHYKKLRAYPGDDAARASIARWMATQADKAGLPPELPVVAALTESGLVNLPPGDSDAAGYFGLRTSSHGTDPEQHLRWFIDHALVVRAQRVAAGLPVDEAAYGDWIADVLRPPEPFRGRYQPRLADARILLCGTCMPKVASAYPGDDAPTAAVARWMATHAEKAGLPPELPVMGALVESGLANLPPGESDAAGYFAMRISIWNTGAYAGFPTDPWLQLQWFVDYALLARDHRLATGLPLTEDAYGEWIADVLRPPEPYRGRYQPRLVEARALLCG